MADERHELRVERRLAAVEVDEPSRRARGRAIEHSRWRRRMPVTPACAARPRRRCSGCCRRRSRSSMTLRGPSAARMQRVERLLEAQRASPRRRHRARGVRSRSGSEGPSRPRPARSALLRVPRALCRAAASRTARRAVRGDARRGSSAKASVPLISSAASPGSPIMKCTISGTLARRARARRGSLDRAAGRAACPPPRSPRAARRSRRSRSRWSPGRASRRSGAARGSRRACRSGTSKRDVEVRGDLRGTPSKWRSLTLSSSSSTSRRVAPWMRTSDLHVLPQPRASRGAAASSACPASRPGFELQWAQRNGQPRDVTRGSVRPSMGKAHGPRPRSRDDARAEGVVRGEVDEVPGRQGKRVERRYLAPRCAPSTRSPRAIASRSDGTVDLASYFTHASASG